jgi:F-box protein 18 (helicase)
MSQGIVSHPPPQQQHDPSHDSQVSMSQGSVFEGLLDDDAFDEIDLSQVSMSKGSVSHPPPPQQQQQQDPSHGSQISMSQGSVYEGMLDDDAFAEINLDAEHLAEQVRKQAGQSSAAAAPLQPQQQPAQRMAQLPSQIPALPHAPPTMPPQWRLQLDAEQHAVVRRDLQPGELLAVVAAAGAGKSTVLLEYARARPQLKCLFLSFAKADAEEKERTIKQEGLQNVEVKTTHSLAFLPTKRFHNRDVSGHLWIKWELLPVRTGSGLRTPKGSNVDASKLVESILGGFFASTDLRIQWTHLEPHRARAHQQVDKNGWDAVECAQNVWHVMCDPSDTRQKLTHDGYIKLFQLDRQMQKRVLGSYDVVMLDEAHDCTPAQIDIVEHANWCRRLAVYDPHQCIYQFRRARDADTLDSLPAVARLPLTQAYRYGAPLSEAASQLIRHYKGGAHSAFRISGSTAHSTELKPCSGSLADAVAEVASRARGAPFQLVALARLNKTLVVLAVELMQAAATSGRTHSLAFAGGKLPRASECLDVARLQLGAHRWGDVQDKFVRKFARHGRGGGFDEFKLKVQEENKAGDRQELADALDLLEQYGARPLEQHVHAIGRATARRHDEAELLFSTTHKSKGLGWPHVFLADDFMARGMSVDDAATAALKVAAKTPGATGLPVLGERALVRSPDRLFRLLGLDLVEEVNTTYVGMTRAKHSLFPEPSLNLP